MFVLCNSSSDVSDSDIDANLIPVTARATPYLQDSLSAPVHPPFHHTTSYHAQNIFKKHLRYVISISNRLDLLDHYNSGFIRTHY